MTRRVGLLVPWANVAVEQELPQLLTNTYSFHSARLRPKSGTEVLGSDFLSSMIERSPEALEQLSRIELDAIVFACTSAQFTADDDEGIDRIRELCAPVPLVTAYDSIVATIAPLSQTMPVHLVGAYEISVTELEAIELESDGVQVGGVAALGRTAHFELVSTNELVSRGRESESGLILFSCTGLLTAEAVRILQADGFECWSSNSCIAQAIIGLGAD